MYRRVLAFDYDGTLAENGSVPPALEEALEQLHLAGCALFLVTGRRFQSASLDQLSRVFTGIVWENGAVLCRTATSEVYMPFGYLPTHLIEALDAADVPLEHGLAIVSTWEPYEETVVRVIGEWGGDEAVVRNKGAIMILPPGTTKGTGLERLLELCGFSPRNLVSFGDGENDVSLLQVGEFGVAVADAVPGLHQIADLVTSKPGPQGVLEVLDRYWLTGNPLDIPSRHERWIPLGIDEKDDTPVSLSGPLLADGNLGVFGDSYSGKSWLTGLMAESMQLSGYQLLMIDPEGDYQGLRSLPRVVMLHGDQDTLASPALVATLLENTPASVVLSMCEYPIDEREHYIADLLRILHPLKENKIRPHWIVLEEAQSFLWDADSMLVRTLLSMLAGGGFAIVSFRPEHIIRPVLEMLNHCILTCTSEPSSMQAVCQILPISPGVSLAEISPSHILLDGQRVLRLRSDARRVQHIRHLYKYLDMPLPPARRFYFHDGQRYIGLEAASLFEFKQVIPALPLESVVYHQERGDFAAWARGALKDVKLAGELDMLARLAAKGKALRDALLKRVTARYVELRTLR